MLFKFVHPGEWDAHPWREPIPITNNGCIQGANSLLVTPPYGGREEIQLAITQSMVIKCNF
jgi:hypothetical protein